MNILVACEESQRVCKAFRARGYDAFSADILPPSGGHYEWHILGDVRELLPKQENEIVTFKTLDGLEHSVKWDMLIGFPPCTYLTCAGACHIPRQPERIQKGEEAARFFYTLYNAPIRHIALENPRPMKQFGLPPKSQKIEPYEFCDGEDDEYNLYTKRTYLWLKNLPLLMPTSYVMECDRKYIPSWVKVNSNGNKKERTILRSKTFQGVANAMARQWGEYVYLYNII